MIFTCILFIIIMPYTFRVEVGESVIQGKGLFAAEDIPAGAVYWVYHCENPLPIEGCKVEENRVYTRQQLQAVPEEQIKVILHGGIYLSDNDLFLQFRDGSQFMNHSINPNSQIIYPASRDFHDLKSITTQPIAKGEEIYESYSNYYSAKSEWVAALMHKHYPNRINFETTIHEQISNQQTS